MGVTVQGFQSDNGIFASKDFVREIKWGLQHIKFSRVGAHCRNGIAERTIRTIMSKLMDCNGQFKFVANGCRLCCAPQQSHASSHCQNDVSPFEIEGVPLTLLTRVVNRTIFYT